MLFLKKEIRLIFLWFIIFFLRENWSWISWILIYVITLRYLLLFVDCLEKAIYNKWFVVLTMISFFSDIELGIV